MASVWVYTFEDEYGREDAFTTSNGAEARARGERYKLLVIENTYEWVDSEMAWDFRPQADPVVVEDDE